MSVQEKGEEIDIRGVNDNLYKYQRLDESMTDVRSERSSHKEKDIG
jgi:hypothetical protein